MLGLVGLKKTFGKFCSNNTLPVWGATYHGKKLSVAYSSTAGVRSSQYKLFETSFFAFETEIVKKVLQIRLGLVILIHLVCGKPDHHQSVFIGDLERVCSLPVGALGRITGLAPVSRPTQ